MDKVLNIVYRIYSKFINLFGLKKYVLFESIPDFSDNTLYVFNEMIKRGLNKKYKFIWVMNHDDSINIKYFEKVQFHKRNYL